MPTYLHIKLGQIWLKCDACPVVSGLACCDLGDCLAAHVVGEGLQEPALPLAVTGLYTELCAEDVGQLGSVAITTTSYLHNRSAAKQHSRAERAAVELLLCSHVALVSATAARSQLGCAIASAGYGKAH